MASPLTLYVQIQPDPTIWKLAEIAVANFAKGVKDGLDATQIVHYATLALVPTPNKEKGVKEPGYAGILLMTDFDLAMDPYLEVFWKQGGGIEGGIGKAILGLAALSFNPVAPIKTLTDFQNFIHAHNLTEPPKGSPDFPNFYQAYTKTVKMINAKS